MSFRWDFDPSITNFGINLQDALQKSKANKLFVVAAGNDNGAQLSSENQLTHLIPLAFYGKDNVIIVSALNKNGSGIYEQANRNAINPYLADTKIVDLLAPGADIPSTCGGDSLAYLSGTSMATAFVSSAALLLNEEGLKDPRFVKIRLLYTSNFDADFISSVNYGSINVERALKHRADKFCKGLNDCKSIRRAYLGNNTLKNSPPELVEIISSETDSNIMVKESSIYRVSCKIVNSKTECTVGYLQSTDSKNKLAGAKVQIIKHVTGLRDFNNRNDYLGIVVESGPEKRTYYSLGEFDDFIRRIDTSSAYISAN